MSPTRIKGGGMWLTVGDEVVCICQDALADHALQPITAPDGRVVYQVAECEFKDACGCESFEPEVAPELETK